MQVMLNCITLISESVIMERYILTIIIPRAQMGSEAFGLMGY